MTRTTRFTALSLLAAAGLTLSACGGGSPAPAATTSAATTSASATATPASESGLTVSDTWVKAAPSIAESKMTGAFGMIRNTTDRDVTIVSATNDAAPMTELHETVMVDGKKKMRRVDGGFVVKAGQTFELKPGGNHIMLMGMTKPLAAGTDVKFTLTTKDGKTLRWSAPAKTYTAPPEDYMGGSATTGATTK